MSDIVRTLADPSVPQVRNGLLLHVTIGLVSGFFGSPRAMLVSQSPQSNLPIPPIRCCVPGDIGNVVAAQKRQGVVSSLQARSNKRNERAHGSLTCVANWQFGFSPTALAAESPRPNQEGFRTDKGYVLPDLQS